MRPHSPGPRALAAAAFIACAAALIPVASLAATHAPAAGRAPAAARAAGVPACSTAGLVVWMDTQGGGYAGGTGYQLRFTNLSGHACALYGNPGVSAVSLVGGQLGKPASWYGTPSAVTLANGATATATLLVTDVGVYPASACHPVTAAGLRIYPPGQTAAKVIPFPFAACSASGPVYLSASPIQP